MNDAPIAFNDTTQTGTEDIPFFIAVTLNDTDVDNATGSLTITGLTQPSTGATLSISGQSILASPSLNYCGTTPRTFTYQVTDASGATSNVATGSFAITCVNDAPTANDDSFTGSEDISFLMDVITNDTDVDNLT